MTAPVPEEENAALDLTEAPPGEHASDAPGSDDGVNDTVDDQVEAHQGENAESSLDQPSQ